jgi:hypothetical protein
MRMRTVHPTGADDAPMANPAHRIFRGYRGRPALPPEADLADEVSDCYVEWCESAGEVATAYQRWSEAPSAEERARYSAYIASLDQEQSAALAYELAVEHCLEPLARTFSGGTR